MRFVTVMQEQEDVTYEKGANLTFAPQKIKIFSRRSRSRQ